MTPKKKGEQGPAGGIGHAGKKPTCLPSSVCPPEQLVWRSLFDSTNEGIVTLDAALKVTNANESAARLLGKPVARLVGMDCPELLKKAGMEPVVAFIESVRAARSPKRLEMFLDKCGVWLLLRADPIIDESGALLGLVLRLLDITACKKTEAELRASEQRYRLLFEQAADPVMLVDAETGALAEFNEMAHAVLGYSREKFARMKMADLDVPPSRDEADRIKQRLLAEGISSHDTRFRASDGSLRDVRVSSRSVNLDGKRFIQSIWRDVTEQKLAEESLQALSLVDDLTGLYNRRGFQTLAEQQLKIAVRMRKKMYLIFLDVDGMKRVNDTLGHREGNQLLVEAASAIRQAFRNSDITARIGGDEFAVLVLEAERLWPAMLRARLDSKIAAKNAAGRNPPLSMSVGIVAFSPEEPLPLEDLLHQADLAMYEEKRGKRNGTANEENGDR